MHRLNRSRQRTKRIARLVNTIVRIYEKRVRRHWPAVRMLSSVYLCNTNQWEPKKPSEKRRTLRKQSERMWRTSRNANVEEVHRDDDHHWALCREYGVHNSYISETNKAHLWFRTKKYKEIVENAAENILFRAIWRPLQTQNLHSYANTVISLYTIQIEES